MNVHLCAAGVTLRKQINRKWKKRDKKSDGWVGNAAHAKTKSDHNPDKLAGGVVRALDIDAELNPKVADHILAETFVEQLREAAKAGEDRISYIIFQGKIASPVQNWRWRKYTGASPHNHHFHISFAKSGDLDGAKFRLPILRPRILGGTPAAKNS